LIEGLGLIEAGMYMFEDVNSNKQKAAATRQIFMSMVACCEEILQLSHQTSVLDVLKDSCIGTCIVGHRKLQFM
jgi:hypothetical protein